MHEKPRRRAVAALSGLAVAAATLTGGAAATAAATGVLTPAIGVNPHHVVAGRVSLSDPKATTFSCQTTTPATCYGPDQIRAAYGVDKLSSQFKVNGSGRTIVIVDAFQSPTIAADLAAFDTLYGLPAPKFNVIAPDGLTPFDQSNADQTSWAGEISLDVEWAHAIAPGATIDLVLAKSDQDPDIYSAQKYAVGHNLGDVLSQSFGEAEQCMDPTVFAETHTLFAQAAKEKMTVFASSGDQGAAQPTCDTLSHFKAVSTPASDPQVTGVGGTLLTADGITGAYQSETAWNESAEYAAAGGGGYSVSYATPAFQKSLKLPMRGVPDVAYNAGIDTGVLTVWSTSGQGAGLVFLFGGTSAGSPQWAGLAALGDQLGRHRMGNINDELYLLGHQPLYGQLYHDVTTGDNTYTGDVTVQGYAAAKGWDPATGLGTPKSQNLVPLLAATAW